MIQNKYLEEFVLIQSNFKNLCNCPTPKDLYTKLFEWTRELSDTKDISVKKMYLDYLAYFGEINPNDYDFSPKWYDFDELLNIDFLSNPGYNLNNVIVTVRDILWEIIAFKTDKECKNLIVDNLRVLTNKQKSEIYFCCDNCGYIENIEGKMIRVNEILYPATCSQISRYNIQPNIFK